MGARASTLWQSGLCTARRGTTAALQCRGNFKLQSASAVATELAASSLSSGSECAGASCMRWLAWAIASCSYECSQLTSLTIEPGANCEDLYFL